jgi:putative ABC transport system substrate-binding protein
MRRREFIAGLGSAAGWPVLVHAQQPLPVVGYAATDLKNPAAARFLTRVREGLAERGYVEDKNFRFELRSADNQYDLLPTRFRELVDQEVSVIVVDTTLKLDLAKKATQSIPIVFNIGVDPVEAGFVASLNKPGGNITGTSIFEMTLGGKQIEILHELVPTATKFATLIDPRNITNSKFRTAHLQAAADSLGVGLLSLDVNSPDEFEAAFETAVRSGAGGMIVGVQPIFNIGISQLMDVAARYRLPTIYLDNAPVKAGGLVSYSSDKDEDYRVVGRYAGRILKGEKPADIPVTRPAKMMMAINLKTAKVLGITFPSTLLARADEVIE